MPKLYSGRDVTIILKRAGFWEVSQRGSHIKLRGIRNNKLQTVIVPDHKQVAQGTFRSILIQAGITLMEFENFKR